MIGWVPDDTYQLTVLSTAALAPLVMLALTRWKVPEAMRRPSVYVRLVVAMLGLSWLAMGWAGYNYKQTQRELRNNAGFGSTQFDGHLK